MLTQKSKLKTQNSIAKLKNHILIFVVSFFIVTFHFSLFTFHLSQATAQSSSNNNFNLEIQDIDPAPDTTIVTPVILDETPTPTPTPIEKKPGIESLSQTGPMTFSMSHLFVDYGSLTPNNPIVRTMTISAVSPFVSFQVAGSQDRSLTAPETTEIIPDVTCDGGNCDDAKDALWKNNLTFGFGYRCDNLTYFVCVAFTSGEYYKQFPNLANNEVPEPILVGKNNKDEQSAKITFKVNTSGAQKAKSYKNTVTFIAVPNF